MWDSEVLYGSGHGEHEDAHLWNEMMRECVWWVVGLSRLE